MKALVLCGGIPQAALIKELKSRGIETILADMNENVVARAFADKFYPVSALDVDAVRDLAKKESVDFLITVCADQVLQVVAQISEELGLPCYINFETAENVSKKSYMKRIFEENGVPSSSHVAVETFEFNKISKLNFPLIVKPVDSFSSRGVKRVDSIEEAIVAFENAKSISRTKTAIIEEFVEGDELTVDVYVENGVANVLSISNLYKIGEDGKFVIHRSQNPADISDEIELQIKEAAQKIATAFGLVNTPMLIQLISTGERISVIEFCARTGGGIKFSMIKKVSGFDVVSAVVDLTLGIKPHYDEAKRPETKYTINEFLYCKPGVLDHFEGFEELLNEGVIVEYHQFKPQGYEFKQINCSGDRVGYYSVEADSREEAWRKHDIANEKIKAISINGDDLIRHDIVAKRK